MSSLTRPRENNFSSSSEKTRPPVFLAFGESARAEISATKRRGNSCRSFRQVFFSSLVWRFSLEKNRTNGHELFTNSGRSAVTLLSRFRAGEHGNERKKAVRCDAGGHSAPACRHEFRRLHATHSRGGVQSADRSLIGDRSSRSNGASRLRETRSPAERIWFASWLVSASRASEKACTGV